MPEIGNAYLHAAQWRIQTKMCLGTTARTNCIVELKISPLVSHVLVQANAQQIVVRAQYANQKNTALKNTFFPSS